MGALTLNHVNAMPAATWHQLHMNETTVDVPEGLLAARSAVVEADEALLGPQNAFDTAVARQIDRWIDEGNFTHQGLTIAQLAQQICTNRTYLSAYINRRYRMSFRDWINSLRLDHAKKLLTTTPDLTIADIAQRAGYMSLSNFTRLFTASEGIPPGRWRKEKGL